LGCTRSGASISKHYASIAFTDDEDAELLNSLADNTYDAAVERAVVVGVEAYDWNCQQHITPRFTVEVLQAVLASTTNNLSPHRVPTGA
jgi:predicted pyridoxine 5'-phosphate oxidase superfamily flavin-nucleotide-binding protein